MNNFKTTILEKAKLFQIEDKVVNELQFLDNIKDKDDKPFLETLENYYNEHKGKVGHKNDVNLWSVFVLGLTDKKPEENKTFIQRRIFARGYPDVDVDFDYERRNEVYQYLIQKYGKDHVGNIGTYNAIKIKSYIAKAFKALDPDHEFREWEESGKRHTNQKDFRTAVNLKAREIVDSLPRQFGAKLKVRDENGKEHTINTVRDAYKYCRDFRWYMDKYPDLLSHSEHIEGLLSVYGVHPAGIIISSVPLSDIAPVRQTKIKKHADGEDDDFDPDAETEYAFATQFPNEDLEKLGLIKFDVLALAALSVIKHCLRLVKENYGIEIDIKNLPLNDQKTFDLYKSGRLVGVFQCEEHGMQEILKQISVSSFDDIVAGIALYRPGPIDSIPEYCARKHGMSPVNYYHKSIEPYVKLYLQKTYGILCYQEQIMQICNSLAGFSITEGYQVIKAVSKKKESDLKRYKKQFVHGCVVKNINEQLAADYWDKFITPFALYGFNKSHAAAYGYLSYSSAYLKANFPEEFMCAFLNVEVSRSKYKKIAKLETEVKKMNMEMLPRRVNYCKMDYEIVTKKDIANGIAQSQIRPSIRCKGLRHEAALSIVKNAPYNGVRDFAERTDTSVVDMEAMKSLIAAGFFGEEKLEEFCGIREDLKRIRRKGLQSLDIFGG